MQGHWAPLLLWRGSHAHCNRSNLVGFLFLTHQFCAGQFCENIDLDASWNFYCNNLPLSQGGHVAPGDQKSFVLPC